MGMDHSRAIRSGSALLPSETWQPTGYLRPEAISSLALGIGANTAIFSFMDSILLRSLPVSDPQSLVVLNWHAKGYSE